MMRDKLIEVLNKEFDRFPEGKKHMILRLENGMSGAPSSIVDVLLTFPEVEACVGKYLNFGDGASLFDPHLLAFSIVRKALEDGVDRAVDALYGFLERDYNSRIQVALLYGIKVDREYEIYDGVFISGLEGVPSVRLKELLCEFPIQEDDYFKDFLYRHFSEPKKLPDAVLYRISQARPKFFSREDPALFDGDFVGTFFLLDVIKLLTLMGPSAIVSVHSFSELHSDELLSNLRSSSGVSSYSGGYSRPHVVTSGEVECLKLVLVEYFKLNKVQREKFDVPLYRLNEAVRHVNPIDRAIDLGVALESLLLHGENEKVQLSLQLRLRGAWLLGENAASRKRIYFHLRDLYNYRSGAAHSGRLTKKAKDYALAEASLKDGLKLCADAIKALIFAKDFLWEDLLLGEGLVKLDAGEEYN